MNPRLLEHFHVLCDRALAAKAERDPEPIIEALGYALWLAALRERERIGAKVAKDLERVGRRALLALEAGTLGTGPQLDAEDAAHASRALADIVRAALVILRRGDASAASVGASALLHPPTSTLARMLAGRADGLTAGRYGLHVMSCAACQRELSLLRIAENGSEAREPLRLAAAGLAHVRAPNEGTVVARKSDPKMEAVLFSDTDTRRLAIYANADAPVRVVADGVTTEEALQGYWLGRVDPSAKAFSGKLYLGRRALGWSFALGAPATGKGPRGSVRRGRRKRK